MLVPAENVEKWSPPLEDRRLNADEARELQQSIEFSANGNTINWSYSWNEYTYINETLCAHLLEYGTDGH